MVAFSSPLFAAAGVLAVPAPTLVQRSGTPSSTGTNNGFYYSFWTDGGATVKYTNEAAGEYSVTWSDSGNLLLEKDECPELLGIFLRMMKRMG